MNYIFLTVKLPEISNVALTYMRGSLSDRQVMNTSPLALHSREKKKVFN